MGLCAWLPLCNIVYNFPMGNAMRVQLATLYRELCVFHNLQLLPRLPFLKAHNRHQLNRNPHQQPHKTHNRHHHLRKHNNYYSSSNYNNYCSFNSNNNSNSSKLNSKYNRHQHQPHHQGQPNNKIRSNRIRLKPNKPSSGDTSSSKAKGSQLQIVQL